LAGVEPLIEAIGKQFDVLIHRQIKIGVLVFSQRVHGYHLLCCSVERRVGRLREAGAEPAA
jgi:hypothetical protein